MFCDSESVKSQTVRMNAGHFIQVYILTSSMLLCYSEKHVQGFLEETCEEDYGYIPDFIQKQLGWRKIAVLMHGHDVSSLVSGISQSSLQCLVYDLNITDTDDALHEIHQIMFPAVNVVAIMKQDHLLQLMTTVNTFDEKTKRQTDFQHHSKWLLLAEDLNVSDLQNSIVLENVALMLVQAKYFLSNVFTVRHHPRESVFVPVEPCDAGNPVSCYFPNTAYGYNNRHLRVTTLASNTFTYKYVFNGTNHYEGYAMDILDTITEVLNLSYSITEPKDRSWGLPVNGTYDGIVGELFRREVDLAVSDLIINEDRARFMDYIYPPIRTEYHDVLYKRHEPQEYASLFLLVRPFQPLLYLVILSATCAMPFLVAMIESHPCQYPDARNTTLIGGYFTKFKLNLYTYSWDVLKSLARQGFSTHPRTMSGKVLVTSWWLLVLVLTSVYCGNLVAALSAHADSPLFSSLEELLDSDYSVGMDGNSISNTVLEASSNTSVQGRLWAKITNNDPSFLKSDVANHIRRIKQQKYALLLFKSTAESYSAEDCQLELLGAEQLWIHLAFGVQKNSPLKDDIQRMMSYLSQSGILEMLWKKWHQQMVETKCVSNRGTMTGISLEQVCGSFILAGVGLVLSTIVLSLEKLKAYKSRLCE